MKLKKYLRQIKENEFDRIVDCITHDRRVAGFFNMLNWEVEKGEGGISIKGATETVWVPDNWIPDKKRAAKGVNKSGPILTEK